MPSILDTFTISDADLRMTKRASCAEVDEKSSFRWHFVYSVYLDADDSDFERRVCSLFAPYGDVIIKDYRDWRGRLDEPEHLINDSEAFDGLYKKKILLFNRPRHFRTDVRVMIHFLIAIARAQHPSASVMYLRHGMLAARYTSITPADAAGFLNIYDTYVEYPLKLSLHIAQFLDDELIRSDCQQENGNIITREINRVRSHYLDTIVV